MSFIKKWWKPLLAGVITIVAVILVLIFLDELGDIFAWIIGSSGTIGAGELTRRTARRDTNYNATVTRDTVNRVVSDRDEEVGEPDNRGFVQLELDPSQDNLTEEEVPEGVKPEEVNTRTTITTDTESEGKTQNHFESGLSRRRRNENKD